MTSLQLTDTVGALVRDYPSLAALFETAEIDYCCGGRQTLAEACAQRGIDAQTFLKELEVAIETAPEPAIADLSLTALVDHIETVHHAYLQRELPVSRRRRRRWRPFTARGMPVSSNCTQPSWPWPQS